jgi:hypothetical protein
MPIHICGLCVLHESEWGKSGSPVVASTQAAITKASGRQFSMQGGRLTDCSQADDILGVIILTERTASRIPKSRP